MSITFGQGIRLGGGLSVSTQGFMYAFDPLYIGDALGLETVNLNVYDTGPGQFTALTNHAMTLGNKYMFSWCLTYTTDPANLVGIANRSVSLNDYLGFDTNGIGFGQNGDVHYDDTVIASGLPTWGTAGDCVDLAVDTLHGQMWLRVNGGDWNNDAGADPATNTGGIAVPSETFLYSAVTIGGFNGPSEFGINSAPIYSVPVGFTFADTGYPAFVFTSARAVPDSAGAFDGAFSVVTTSGYTLDSNSDVYAAYYVSTTGDTTDINAAQVAAGMTSGLGYMWYTNWGPGSTNNYGGGISHVWFTGSQFKIVAFDPDPVTEWQTPGPNGIALAGTYQFPVVCTAILPPIEKSGWC